MSGSRGPLTRATSIRGERERQREKQRAWKEPKSATAKKGARLQMPAWIPEASRATWRRVVAGLHAANVGLEKIDGEAIGLYAACLDGAAQALKAGDTKSLTRFERDAIAWAGQIGATPAARARMGVKPQKAADPDNPWAQFSKF